MDLAHFLVTAKTRTYASGRNAVQLADGSKELAYRQDQWGYRDRYFGFDPFAGGEIVWLEGSPVWAMNYYGRTLIDWLPTDTVSSTDIFTFLRGALREIAADRPYRGPTRFQEGDFEYSDVSCGDLDAFAGVETILYRNHEVYHLEYHGGALGK